MAFRKKAKAKAEPQEEEEEEKEEPKIIRRAVEAPSVQDVWTVEEIPIQTQKVLYNSETKQSLDMFSAMAEILNRTEE